MKNKVLLASPHMSKEGYEMEFVKEAFDTNWIAPLGKNVDMFEDSLESYLGGSKVLSLNSGTSALHLALKLAKVQPQDIVFCQSLTFAATINPVIYQNAIPVFIDSEYDTWNMDPVLLEKAILKYPNAKAVIVVHLYGIPAKIEKIRNICKKNNLVLIEDAAESLGTTINGKQTGTFGDFGILSFNGNKIITTSGGGALVCKNEKEKLKAKFWSTQSREKYRHYEHKELGFNYRLSNICAGIGLGQMKVLERRIQKKNEIFNIYSNSFEKNEKIEMMPNIVGVRQNQWLSCALLKIDPIKMIEYLEEHNVEARPVWKPMHLQPYYCNYDFFDSGVSEDLFKRGICLPSDTKLSHEDIKDIAEMVLRLL